MNVNKRKLFQVLDECVDWVWKVDYEETGDGFSTVFSSSIYMQGIIFPAVDLATYDVYRSMVWKMVQNPEDYPEFRFERILLARVRGPKLGYPTERAEYKKRRTKKVESYVRWICEFYRCPGISQWLNMPEQRRLHHERNQRKLGFSDEPERE